jgi:hypothetical protein
MPGQPKAKASWTRRLRERRHLRNAKKAERLHATRGAGDDGITHDFMMLNPLSDTHATRAAVAQAISVLRETLRTA